MFSISSILKIFMMPSLHRKLPVFPEHHCGDDSTCSDTSHKIPPVPLLPIPPPIPPVPLPPSRHVNPKHNTTITMRVVSIAVVASLLFGFLFLVAIIWRYCHRQNVRVSGTPVLSRRHVDSLQEDDRGGVDHPIWLINTAGLDRSVIDSIEVCEFKKGDGLIDGVECTICLGEFEEGEDLRLLPKCSHAFHVPCIDTWLRSHKNCPLCRAPIVRDVLLPCCEINLEESRSNRGILGGSSMTVSGNDDAGERNSDGEGRSRGENRVRKENRIRPRRSLSSIHSSSVMVPRLTTGISNHSRFAKEAKNVRGAVCTRNNDESSCNKIRKSSSDAGILSFEKSSR